MKCSMRYSVEWTHCNTFNIICVVFHATSLSDVSKRAETHSIINMAPLFVGAHWGFVADLLGLSLSDYRRVHRSAGLMSFVLVALRMIPTLHETEFSVTENIYLIIVNRIIDLACVFSLMFYKDHALSFYLWYFHRVLCAIFHTSFSSAYTRHLPS